MDPKERRWIVVWSCLVVVLLALVSPAYAQSPSPGPDPESVPKELEPWIEWVRESELPPGNCRTHEEATICIWPTRVALELDDEGGSFKLEVAASEADLVELPGDDDAWPQEVRVDGKPALVIDNGVPQVHVDAGLHRVEGRFTWRERPDQLHVPEEIALVELLVGEVSITFPSRSGAILDIPAPAPDEELPEDEIEPDEELPEDEVEPEPDSERIDVSRLVEDGVPLVITTRVDLRISGQDRELRLPYPVWDDAKLVKIDSDLPVTLDEDKSVVVKARSGSYTLTFTAQLPRAPEQLAPPVLASPWPASEVWIWKAQAGENPNAASMGQVALSGGSPVDRTRTHAPEHWPEGATYSVTADTPLQFEILQRGIAESAPNELALTREAIFDLAGTGWYFRDRISGTMNSSSRLDLQTKALGSVVVDDTPQVITVNNEGLPGVEIRNPAVNLVAQWRQEGETSTIPLAGWSESFTRANLEFKIPRGWDLLYIAGPGQTSETWLERWDPLHAILLLGVCIALGLWVDPKAGAAAFVGLVLVFNANDEGFLPLLALLAGLAGLQRAMQRPTSQRMGWALRAIWGLGAFVLVAWVALYLPADLEQVWRQGRPALGQLELEDASEGLAGLTVLAALVAVAISALAGLIAKFGGFGSGGGLLPKLLLPGLGVLAILAILSVTFLRSGDMAPESAQMAMYMELPEAEKEQAPPEEEYRRQKGKYDAAKREEAPANGMMAPGSSEDEDVWGGLTGSEVGEAYGVGGLGLVGTGRGGGGTGDGTIGLGNTGLIGKGGGGGTGSGYGRGSGAGFGGRGKRVPAVRTGKAEVQGPLERDVVRRIVRAHINEIRSCYNAGLTNKPGMAGRVELQFAISGTGKVDSSVVKSSTLADSSVGACMAKAVKRWKFPKPEGGGAVIVSLPFTLSDGGGGGDETPSPTRYLESEDLPEAPPPEIPQTGQARPDWDGRVWTVSLERSAKEGEQLELYLLSPLTNKLLALLRGLALAGLALALVLAGWGNALTTPASPHESDEEDGKKDGVTPNSRSKAAGAAAAVLVFILATPALARAAPPAELLEELSDRVNEERERAPSPSCGDDCALVPTLRVQIEGDTLTLDAELHMEAPGVYTIPGPLSAWAPSSVIVDGKPASAIIASNNQLLIRMDEGLHQVRIRGPVAGDTLNLSLGIQPKRVEIEAEAEIWQVSGVDTNDTATNLTFLREQDQPDSTDDPTTSVEPDAPVSEPMRDDSKTSQELPVWLAVTREIEIGPRWSMRTKVRRVNAGDTPIKIKIPLLEGERLIESSHPLEDPKATITLERGDDSVSWTSVLDTREQLVLEAPIEGKWSESWVFTCGAAWQCDAEGVPPTERSGARSVYHPWPGESLAVALFKPTPAEGPRLSVDDATLLVQIGEEGSTMVLSATVRTSTVGERTITIPSTARLETVRVDGKEIPTNKDSAAIRLTFQPGVHPVRIEWQQDEGWSSSYTTPAVSLGGEAINTHVRVEFSDDRSPVLLRTSSAAWGPQVWFWASLLAMAALALLLHVFNRDKRAVKLHDWFLLSFGFRILVLPLVLAWFLLLGQRKHLVSPTSSPRRYNTVHLSIWLLTVVLGLVALATAHSLLTQVVWTMPENFYGDELLSWYADQTDDAMPQGKVLSVPSSAWRVLGIAWVAWFGWRCVAWFKWGRAELSAEGWFRSAPPSEPEPDMQGTLDQLEAPAPDNTAGTVTQLDNES